MFVKPDYFARTVTNSDWEGRKVTTYYFDSLVDYQKFIQEVKGIAPRSSKAGQKFSEFDDPNYVKSGVKEGKSWYGTTDASLVTQDISSYLFNDKLQDYLGSLKRQTINIDVADIDQTKNIKFTDKEIGIFSFDLASLGLIKVFEYYSPVLQKIVNGNNVLTEKDADGKTIKDSNGKPVFFHKYKPSIPEHEIVFNAEKGGYYSDYLGRVVKEDEIKERNVGGITFYYYPATDEIQKHIVERRQKLTDSGKPMWATTFKKVFIEIPKIEKSLPRIDIIVGASFAASKNAETEMIYSSMAAIALAERLSKANVNYRIIAAFGVRTSEGEEEEKNYGFINLKKEGEPLDKNRISILLSDGRFLRYLQFMGYVGMLYDSGADQKISSGIARPINEQFFIARNQDGKFIVVSIKNTYNSSGFLIAQDGKFFDTEIEAETYARNKKYSVNEIKNAYMDYLAASSSPSDVQSSKFRETKLVFTGALSESDAKNQYDLMMSQITKL